MKKFLVVLAAVLMLVNAFAAFTLGTVSYSGYAYFSLTAEKDTGIDLYGETYFSITLPTGTDSSFGLSFYCNPDETTAKLASISFQTPYFGALYSTDMVFVSHYFAGKNTNGKPVNAMVDFASYLKLTFPVVKDLEVYYFDKKDEGENAWFSDMLLAKYAVAGWTVVGGIYNTGDTDKYEYGVAANGSVDLGVVKPSVQAFAGMVQGTSEMEMAYDFKLSATYKPVAFLTLDPEVRFAENVSKLDYKSVDRFVKDQKYVKLGVTYEQTFAPVTVKAQVTPTYDVSSQVFNLYLQGNLKTEQFGVTAEANWLNIQEFDNYQYIRFIANANVVKDLTLTAKYRMEPGDKWGYNVIANYAFSDTVTLEALYGTLDKWATTISSDPTWKVAVEYSAEF
ncbi:hypothetical protein [Fervidobacterium sp. 2310opik-2]|uniref:hypothetical protein n=1 Tax=Fervidobacterium sp. 2310opik-2 TaxID=1755815 RepID=UPI0013DF7ACC|nr:hypothetical protein [Fervidobacterium sp. 2310opik-2]KAF2961897.1 hypothetical protein AS161_07345 [Fervidobacterium sp. 2310opik-2]